MHKLISLIVVLAGTTIFPYVLLAQNYDNVWLMSDVNGGVEINFSSGIPVVFSKELPIIMRGASAVISDVAGNLISYTNGCQFYGNNDQLLPGGSGINPGEIHNEYCSNSAYPTARQATVVLPEPESENDFIVLHKPIEYEYNQSGQAIDIRNDGLFYSKIIYDSVDNTRKIIEKNVAIDLSSFENGAIATVRHGNGEDWWIISPMHNSNEYAVFLLDSSGVYNHGYFADGFIDTDSTDGSGQSRFSPSGDKYFRFNVYEGLQYWDFDRITGEGSNYRFLPLPIEFQVDWFTTAGGVAMSPSERFLYVTNGEEILQYDFESADIENSVIKVGEVLNTDSLFIPPSSFSLQLGPDCKIYAFSNSGWEHHVIHNPDEQGLACDFEQGYLQMPYPVFRDHPYYPNYRLGPIDNPGSPCAEPLVGLDEIVEGDEELTIWPNPASNQISMSGHTSISLVEIFDQLGRKVLMVDNLAPGLDKIDVSISELKGGMYSLRVRYVDHQWETVKVVVNR
ncbi:hypothetical protein CEQ90_07895 [Lewinellaceae bacterium SD302]|nr:hypothetical protein CEQ90_07895 [Lewinellaceae bacterium SD302]